jgi:hypothetical protein
MICTPQVLIADSIKGDMGGLVAHRQKARNKYKVLAEKQGEGTLTQFIWLLKGTSGRLL